MSGESPEADDSYLAAVAGVGVGSTIAGYRLEERIGHGGMAAVFRARDQRLGRQVAIKVLVSAFGADEAFRQRFIRESRAAAAVDDPCIIPIFEAGEADGVLFIAMRYVSGGDVRTLVRRHGPLSPWRAAAILSPVASALDAAHSAGLVHRDVKPANMLLDVRPGRPDHVYLSDFGLSKGSSSTAGVTGTGAVMGTPDYLAPEQIAGQQVDGRADQYALACTAIELLTGAPPFPRDHGMAVIYAHASEPPPSVTSRRPGLPVAVDAVLARALAKDPASRYPTCRDFTESLRESLGIPSYDAEPQSHPGTGSTMALPVAGGGQTGVRQNGQRRPRRRPRARLAALIAGCAVALAAAGLYLAPSLINPALSTGHSLPPVNGWLRAAAISADSTWVAGRYCASGCQAAHGAMDRPLMLRWNDSAWTRAEIPDVGASSWLRAVSPGQDGAAWAVGGACVSNCSTPTGVLRPLILRWAGTTWSQVAAPGRLGAAFLTAVSPGPAGTAWAAGTSCGTICGVPGSAADQPLILHWDGARWSAIPSPSSGAAALAGVSANPSGGAWAVGYSCLSGCHTSAEVDQPLILQWHGTNWSSAPGPGAGISSVLSAVSAGPSGTAWAVGHSCVSGCGTGFEIDQTLIVHWNGTAWQRIPSPSPGGRAFLSGVSAAPSGTAWAVGYSCVSRCGTPAATDRPLILHWDGTAWLKVPCQAPGSSGRAALASVTAIRSGAAWAAGYSCVSGCGTASELDQALVLRWTGTSWVSG